MSKNIKYFEKRYMNMKDGIHPNYEVCIQLKLLLLMKKQPFVVAFFVDRIEVIW